MSEKNRNISGFSAVVGLLICIPAIFQLFQFPTSEPLKGAQAIRAKPNLNWQNWWDGSYQENFEDYVADDISLKPPLVRAKNQFLYDVFDRPNARFVVKGKEEYLYEDAYIKAHYGMDFLGEKKWDTIADQLLKIENFLYKKGIEFVVVLAPGKGSFYPEFIPDRYKKFESSKTNFTSLKERIEHTPIDYIDMSAWFQSMKSNSEYPLFPKTGTHWSTYGMHLAADSIMQFLERKSRRDLPEWNWYMKAIDELYRDQDRDIEEGLNLLRPIENFPMAYPEFEINVEGKTKLKSAVVADSYFWNMYNHGFSSRAFDEGEFWYYANQVYPQSFDGNYPLTSEHISNSLDDLDVIILLATDGTLDRFPWGFEELMEEEVMEVE